MSSNGITDAEWKSVITSPYSNHFSKGPIKSFDSVYLEEFDPVGWV